MLILLTNNPAPADQTRDVEPQPSNTNTVEVPEAQHPTLAEFEVENSSIFCQMCKLIPTWSMTSNLPMIPNPILKVYFS